MTALDDIKGILDDIDNKGRYLSDWEADFLDKMLGKVERGEYPTKREMAAIDSVYAQRVMGERR